MQISFDRQLIPRTVGSDWQRGEIKGSVLSTNQLKDSFVVGGVTSKVEATTRTNHTPSSPQRLQQHRLTPFSEMQINSLRRNTN